MTKGWSVVQRVQTFFAVALLAVLAVVAPEGLRAQDMDNLGVVWNNTYGPGAILNIKPTLDGNYTACGYIWTSVSPKLERPEGLLVEFDESGNALKRATLRIP
jgi:hypothetical protein